MAMLVLLALRDEDYISTDVLRIAVVLNASVYSTAYAIYALSIGITQNPIPLTYALSYTRIYPGLLTIPFLPTLRHIAKHMGCSIAENRGAAK